MEDKLSSARIFFCICPELRHPILEELSKQENQIEVEYADSNRSINAVMFLKEVFTLSTFMNLERR